MSPICQAILVELKEEPLAPTIELRQAADDLPLPIEDRADAPKLVPHPIDVRHRPGTRMHAVFNRRVLSRQAESVETHGRQNVIAAHPHEANVSVMRRIVVPVTNVEIAGRVRIHGKLVPLGTRIVVVDAVETVRRPALPPLTFNGSGLVGLGHRNSTAYMSATVYL